MVANTMSKLTLSRYYGALWLYQAILIPINRPFFKVSLILLCGLYIGLFDLNIHFVNTLLGIPTRWWIVVDPSVSIGKLNSVRNILNKVLGMLIGDSFIGDQVWRYLWFRFGFQLLFPHLCPSTLADVFWPFLLDSVAFKRQSCCWLQDLLSL